MGIQRCGLRVAQVPRVIDAKRSPPNRVAIVFVPYRIAPERGQMEDAMRIVSALLILALLTVVPLRESDARDWKPGDRGLCPGTWDAATQTCQRPYLCEPEGCVACVGKTGN
jgi:hypothetical protein